MLYIRKLKETKSFANKVFPTAPYKNCTTHTLSIVASKKDLCMIMDTHRAIIIECKSTTLITSVVYKVECARNIEMTAVGNNRCTSVSSEAAINK